MSLTVQVSITRPCVYQRHVVHRAISAYLTPCAYLALSPCGYRLKTRRTASITAHSSTTIQQIGLVYSSLYQVTTMYRSRQAVTGTNDVSLIQSCLVRFRQGWMWAARLISPCAFQSLVSSRNVQTPLSNRRWGAVADDSQPPPPPPPQGGERQEPGEHLAIVKSIPYLKLVTLQHPVNLESDDQDGEMRLKRQPCPACQRQ